MIDAKELRIGNLVTENQFKQIWLVNRVETLIADYGTTEYYRTLNISCERKLNENCIIEFCTGRNTDFEPIPLTPEWLEKAGFKTDRNFSFKEPISLILKNKKITFKLTSYHFIDIHSVHQLQNLFFALTGKELEFKNI